MNNLLQLAQNCFRAQGDVKVFTEELRGYLLDSARTSPLRRARINFHPDDSSLVQEMIIAMFADTKIGIHFHSSKSESFGILEGRVLVGLYSNSGHLFDVVDLRSDRPQKFYRLDSNVSHLVVPISEVVILHETTLGPFQAATHHEAPNWASALDIEKERHAVIELAQRLRV